MPSDIIVLNFANGNKAVRHGTQLPSTRVTLFAIILIVSYDYKYTAFTLSVAVHVFIS